MYKRFDGIRQHIGESNIMRGGMLATIVNYHNARNIDIEFEDFTIVKGKTYDAFKKGLIRNPNQLHRTGYV